MSNLKGCRKVEFLIHVWKTQEDAKNDEKMASVATEIAEVAVDCSVEEKDKIIERCYSAFVHITNSCLEAKQFDAARLMALCRLAVLRKSSRKDPCGLLNKLEGLGICFVTLAEYKFNLQEHNEVSELCAFIDEVLELIYDIGDFNKLDKLDKNRLDLLKNKNGTVFTVLLKYGTFCLYKMQNYSKSLAIFSQAVGVLKMFFGSSAKNCKVFVECYYNIAFSHTCFKHYLHAKTCLNKAIAACECASDWDNENEKQFYLSTCMELMKII